MSSVYYPTKKNLCNKSLSVASIVWWRIDAPPTTWASINNNIHIHYEYGLDIFITVYQKLGFLLKLNSRCGFPSLLWSPGIQKCVYFIYHYKWTMLKSIVTLVIK